LDVRTRLATARDAVERIRKTVEAGGSGSVGAALRLASEAEIFAPDARISAYLDPDGEQADMLLSTKTVNTLDAFAACDVGELAAYFQYIRQQSPYSTQHGTKGAEFRKVIVVLDDEEGNYNLYSYEKLFGLKPLSNTDRGNLATGTDSVLERTRRLLYVCVSRAVESLAVVLFVSDVAAAGAALEESGIMAGDKAVTVADLAQ
jgi:DNA helicase-2/ATP-dependent DNA helicase PcrA